MLYRNNIFPSSTTSNQNSCWVSCHHFFRNTGMPYCDCGFENFISIYNQLESARKNLNISDFAKEFLTEKYTVLAKEYVFGYVLWGNGEKY